jgi:hypothetical protein
MLVGLNGRVRYQWRSRVDIKRRAPALEGEFRFDKGINRAIIGTFLRQGL